MAQRKRQYGSGCLLRRKGGWVLRWRETESSPDGTQKRVLRYERLGEMSRKHAADILMQRVAAANTKPVVAPSTWTFRELAAQWQATVLPMYKPSTQKNHRHILAKHLLPRFGDGQLTELGRQDVQAYVASLSQAGYAPKTVTPAGRAQQGDGRTHRSPSRGPDPEHVHASDAERVPGGGPRHRRRIVHNCSHPGAGRGANSLKRLAPQVGLEPTTLRLTAGCSAN